MSTLKRTPLYQNHCELGGKVIPFAGWELPVQYSGIIAEHQAVRERAGLFDVSHMGEVFVTGPEAEKAIDYLTCNDVKTLKDGKAQYSALLNEQGGVVDDIIIYRYDPTRYLICVNASNADKDFAWMSKNNKFKAEFVNRSAEFGQIALQGPAAIKILSSCSGMEGIEALPYFHFCDRELFGCGVIVARTGYTGEDGAEIFVPANATALVWSKLLEAGKPYGLVPAGLGARDSLRLEACLPLHGHELAEDVSAYSSGLGWIIKLQKGDFVGKAALAAEKAAGGPNRALIGFYIDDAGIARHADKVFSPDGLEIGTVTSGTKTPTVNKALGLAIVDKAFSAEGSTVMLEVRGKLLKAHVVKRPFYKRAQ